MGEGHLSCSFAILVNPMVKPLMNDCRMFGRFESQSAPKQARNTKTKQPYSRNFSTCLHTDGGSLPRASGSLCSRLQKACRPWLPLAGSAASSPRSPHRAWAARQSVNKWTPAESPPRLSRASARTQSRSSAAAQSLQLWPAPPRASQWRTMSAVRPLEAYASRSDGRSPTPATCADRHAPKESGEAVAGLATSCNVSHGVKARGAQLVNGSSFESNARVVAGVGESRKHHRYVTQPMPREPQHCVVRRWTPARCHGSEDEPCSQSLQHLDRVRVRPPHKSTRGKVQLQRVNSPLGSTENGLVQVKHERFCRGRSCESAEPEKAQRGGHRCERRQHSTRQREAKSSGDNYFIERFKIGRKKPGFRIQPPSIKSRQRI